MSTRTLGTTGADHTTINLWVAWVQANIVTSGNLTQDAILDTLNVGVSPSASDTISGWSSSTFDTVLTALGTHSFADNASVRSNALVYNASNGAFIDYSSNAASFLTVQIDKMTISRLQFKFAMGNYVNAIKNTYSSNGVQFTIRGNIIWNSADTNRENAMLNPANNSGAGQTVTIDNNLFITACHSATVIIYQTIMSEIYTYYNTFVNTFVGTITAPCISHVSYATTNIIKNNAFINFVDVFSPGNHGTTNTGFYNGTTTATSESGWTNDQFNLNVANEFTGAGAWTDFRVIAAGQLEAGGNPVGGFSTDISGYTRKPTTPTIGCWQTTYVPSTDQVPVRMIGSKQTIKRASHF